jgi:hypothetical protein
MTDEILKKLSRVIEDSDQTTSFPDFPAVFVSCEFKFTSELNLQLLETDQSDLLTNNRYYSNHRYSHKSES